MCWRGGGGGYSQLFFWGGCHIFLWQKFCSPHPPIITDPSLKQLAQNINPGDSACIHIQCTRKVLLNSLLIQKQTVHITLCAFNLEISLNCPKHVCSILFQCRLCYQPQTVDFIKLSSLLTFVYLLHILPALYIVHVQSMRYGCGRIDRVEK